MGVLLGCDFSSSPSAKKAIVCAWGKVVHGCLRLDAWDTLTTLDAFSDCVAQERAWIGGFDLPFGLPRELVQVLGWPQDWQSCMHHYAALSRDDIRQTFAAFCDARPVGSKFAHRATDAPAGSSPSMKWVNPPVAFMLHAGVPRLLAAGVYLPGVQPAPSSSAAQPLRVGLEAYPGLIAKAVLGTRSYKSDDKAKQTAERLIARKDLVHALETGLNRWEVRIQLRPAQRDKLIDDPTGDSLDAVLCLVLATWAERQHLAGHALYGLPAQLDSLEGWIVSA